MLTYPEINPIALDLGPVKIHWYGVMYLLAFAQFWLLGKWRAKQPKSGWTEQEVGDLVFYGAMGVILGGRLGYIFFYNFPAFLDDPLILFRIWEGGMSFHGGLLGVIVAMWLFARKKGVGFFGVADFVAPLVPLGYFVGRLGNFINGELWGRPTDAPWGMVFPHVDNLARHPSMLYQAVLEGLVVFILLWFYSSKPRPAMAVSAMFLILFGVFRTFNEFFRQPDAHLGFIAFDWLTMGQLLSLPMIFAGAIMLAWSYKKVVKN